MPRIRKKTSNRQNTRDRAKIKKHVSEHKRKSAKVPIIGFELIKQDKKQDPGVPNSFPYKDRVLAELAEEKRQRDAAKLARKEVSKQKSKEDDDNDEPDEDTPGIQSLVSSSILTRPGPLSGVSADLADEETNIPDLVDTHLTTLQEVLDKADLILQVVDARDVSGGRSGYIEGLVKDVGGKIALLVNKIDLVPREALQSWMDHIPLATLLYSAGPQSTSPDTVPVIGRAELLAYLSSLSVEKAKSPSTSEASSQFTVALMGLPNTGKSSIINSLMPKSTKKHAVAPAIPTIAGSKNPEPTTKLPSEVRIDVPGGLIKVIDTPGWDYAEDEEELQDNSETGDEDEDEEDMVSMEKLKKWDELEERYNGDLLRRNMGRVDRVKNPVPLANYIFDRSNPQDLMVAYNVTYFKEGDITAFLTSLARNIGRLKKGGQADLDSAARHLLRDWSLNKFPFYTSPPKTASNDDMQIDKSKEGQPDMSAVLAQCALRKEMRRKGKGVIRFRSGEVNSREIILDDDYTAILAPSDDEDEDDDDEDTEADEQDDDDDEEEDGDESFTFNEEDGEELDLEDGPEPSSGSDPEGLYDEDEDEDDENEDEDEEAQEEEDEEEPAPVVTTKLKRKAFASPSKVSKKAKIDSGRRVSFAAKAEVRVVSNSNGDAGRKRKRG